MGALLDLLQRLLPPARRGGATPAERGGATPADRGGPGTQAGRSRQAGPATGYPGDFVGTPRMEWAADADGRPDPGEIVWTWVPYEEDHTQGKDRPVLLIGRDGAWLLGLPLTSKDHHRDEEQERGAGREWVDIGSGGWDRQGRPSEVRVNRILRVDPTGIRREGSILERATFEQVADAVRAHRG